MFKKRNRLFSISTIVLLLIAAAHTMGTLSKPPDDPAAHALIETMKGYTFELGLGMQPSVFDIQMSLSLTMTILLLFMVVMNIMVVKLQNAPAVLLARTALLDAVFVWVLAILYGIFQVTPPFVSFIIAGVLFTLSYFKLRKTD